VLWILMPVEQETAWTSTVQPPPGA
jgi:hypothetical protein